MPISTLEFVELEKKVQKTKKSALDILAPDLGKAYVVAITRDGCPNCEEQKPEFDKLAAKMTEKHDGKVVFVRVHVRYAEGFTAESSRSKDVLHHYFYPTNMILVRTRDRGAFEYYRNVNPLMSKLEDNIELAIETAVMLEKES